MRIPPTAHSYRGDRVRSCVDLLAGAVAAAAAADRCAGDALDEHFLTSRLALLDR